MFSSIGSFHKWLYQRGLGQAEVRTWNSLGSLTLVAKAQALCPSSAAFPGALAPSWIRSRAAENQTSICMGCQCNRQLYSTKQ